MADVYTHGHHESVLRSHTWRTAENSAGYLLGELRPGMELLDIGCGPGTITLDLAARCRTRTGGRASTARRRSSKRPSSSVPKRNIGNARFDVGDVYGLEIADGSFDVVHAHQVLQHLTDPVDALGEMRRVLRPGGQVAVRDSDYGAKIWAPQRRAASTGGWRSTTR